MNTRPFVLVVEDSPTQAKQIAATVSAHSSRVLVLGDGLAALKAIDDEQPDLIVLDITLPGMDGYQVCNRLKRDKNTAHIPIIMMTTAGSADATIHGLEVGADDYIPKDEFAMENLTVTIGAYLD